MTLLDNSEASEQCPPDDVTILCFLYITPVARSLSSYVDAPVQYSRFLSDTLLARLSNETTPPRTHGLIRSSQDR